MPDEFVAEWEFTPHRPAPARRVVAAIVRAIQATASFFLFVLTASVALCADILARRGPAPHGPTTRREQAPQGYLPTTVGSLRKIGHAREDAFEELDFDAARPAPARRIVADLLRVMQATALVLTVAVALGADILARGRPAGRAATRAIAGSETRARLVVPALAVVGTLGAGIGLRIWQINALGYNSDEAVYAGQAASIAGDPNLEEFFPIFRAHPLLFQSVLSIGFHLGADDLFGRLVSAAVGVATICVVYILGSLLYGRKAGMLAAFFIALMPYHVVVTRQVLLDGPMVLFATLSLYLLARFATTERPAWLYAAGAAMGLTFLSKETSILFLGAIYAFFALAPSVRVRVKDLVLSAGIMALVIAPFPLSLIVAGRAETGEQYLTWQLFRRPNHDWAFYPTTVPEVIGPLVILTAIAGLWLLRRTSSWRETLLLSWIAVPVLFFQLWPVKGFQYLLPIAPPIAVLAGRALGGWSPTESLSILRGRLNGAWIAPLATGIIAVTLLIPSWQRIQPSNSATFLAGSGGVPGGREAGEWIDEHVPEGAKLLTIGPSMANILQFYGHRRAYGLSVSPNPLQRNPSYEPVPNPDLLLRSNELQYVVWDAFSASRSPFFSESLLRYADRYNGRAVHTESVTVTTPDGQKAEKPVIVIYEVRP